MCGIAGFADFSSLRAYPAQQAQSSGGGAEVLRRMDESLAERGPDGRGSTLLAGSAAEVGLVHRRLAIIDLTEGGHQPMATPDRTSWITYKGTKGDVKAYLATPKTGPRGP